MFDLSARMHPECVAGHVRPMTMLHSGHSRNYTLCEAISIFFLFFMCLSRGLPITLQEYSVCLCLHFEHRVGHRFVNLKRRILTIISKKKEKKRKKKHTLKKFH